MDAAIKRDITNRAAENEAAAEIENAPTIVPGTRSRTEPQQLTLGR